MYNLQLCSTSTCERLKAAHVVVKDAAVYGLINYYNAAFRCIQNHLLHASKNAVFFSANVNGLCVFGLTDYYSPAFRCIQNYLLYASKNTLFSAGVNEPKIC